MWPFKKKSPVDSTPPDLPPQTYYELKPIAEVEFDIEGEDVFSIERVSRVENDGEKSERTLIGYYDKSSGQSNEWYLDCHIGKHNQFIARFRKKIGVETVNVPPMSSF